MTNLTAQLLSMAVKDITSNGWLAKARDYLAAHPNQMLADPMYLDDDRRTYLYRRDEYVDLHFVGRPDGLPVFILNPLKGWQELADLDAKYSEWSKRNGN